MYLAQSSDRLLPHGWSVVIFRKNIKRPWGCADKLQQMFRCSTSKNLNYRWPRSFVVDLCDFPSCLHQEWKLNVDCVCHVAVLLTLLVFRFYWWVLGKEGGRKEQKEKAKRQNSKRSSHAVTVCHRHIIVASPILVTLASLRRLPSWGSFTASRLGPSFIQFSLIFVHMIARYAKCIKMLQQRPTIK